MPVPKRHRAFCTSRQAPATLTSKNPRVLGQPLAQVLTWQLQPEKASQFDCVTP
jgi:hypothetical protein